MTHTANENEYDMLVDFTSHYQRGNVWRVLVDLPMKGAIDEPEYVYTVAVDVVSPNRDLAQYIVTTMYPEYETISISDEPVSA
tara:strand:+ start:1237 stop:1485 length:249 start_codon:yes stop_codon:yes gene_type:complete